MTGTTSNAEVEVLIELQRHGLLERMHPLGTVIVFAHGGRDFALFPKENFTREVARNCLGFTIPDFPFLEDRLPVYLDGPVHRTKGARNRDDAIDSALIHIGFTPLRFPYRPAIARKKVKEIVNAIKEHMVLEPLGERP